MRRRRRRSTDEVAITIAGPRPLDLSAVVLPTADEEPRPKLSILRVLLAVAVIGGACYGGFVGLRAKVDTSAATLGTTWFAPYVDVTLTPTYQFQVASNDPARQTVLGFVVAASPQSCVPSWGAAYSLPQANEQLALSSRIAQLQSDGAEVVASFGGAKNTSLDVACSTPAALADAYQSVIDEYSLQTIDLDIEGPALDNFAAEQRRAAAVRLLEQAAARAHRTLKVWLTLPVEPSGLQDNALSVVASMFRDHVQIAGINIMAMDFSHPPSAGSTMLDLVKQSMNATDAQLSDLLPRYGIHLSAKQVWQRLGVTVMIGQNNIAGELFTVADAEGLRSFAQSSGIARVSMWSINRDQQCGANFSLSVLSNTCSGVPESNLEMTDIFNHLSGSAETSSSPSEAVLVPAAPDTNPANAPFPTWNPTSSYAAHYLVVENGEIYQAKWYNSAQDPGAQYQYSWESPWELIGPVLASDHAPVIAPLAAGTYPNWSAKALYVAGTRVLFQGLGYRAKWSSQGVSPGIDAAMQPSSPWTPLFNIPGEPSGAT
jgi:chitinase